MGRTGILAIMKVRLLIGGIVVNRYEYLINS